MLEIKDLHASVNSTAILKGLNLSIREGEIHAIMGPNGSGKSTLSKVIAGHPDFAVDSGSISFDINMKMRSLVDLSADERAREGIFLAFQYPTEVPGVSNFEFLRAAFNAVTVHQGGEEMDVLDFNEFLNQKINLVGIDESFVSRQVNVAFSGGEKKRNEILQMAVLSPRLAILDETDSGLDIDSLRAVASGINRLRSPNNAMILITHYQRILNYVVPDHVHILHQGRIVQSGDYRLAKEVEEKGYEPFIN